MTTIIDALTWFFAAETLWLRLVVGGSLLGALAVADVIRNGRAASRPREYAFLLYCVAIAIVYGVVNDQVTVTISWEYFFYGKGLYERIGANTPPDMMALRLQTVRIGAMATWWVGLILGAAALIANNPKPGKALLPWGQMMRIVIVPLLIAGACGAVVGLLGYFGALKGLDADIAEMWTNNEWRPARFSAAWGVHLGGYVGGLIGGIVAIGGIVRKRKQLTLANKDQTV